MVKVKEFCCGCSLRSGTFIIAWCSLIWNAILFSMAIIQFISLRRRAAEDLDRRYEYRFGYEEPSPYILAYTLIKIIFGIAASVIALWALHKNKLKFANGLFWYLCYMVACLILSEILLLIEPNWEKKLSELNGLLTYYSYKYFENIITLMMYYGFIGALVAYFALIVKSYLDYSMRNEAQNSEFVGPDATTAGYRAA